MLHYMLDSNLCIQVMRTPKSATAEKFKQHHGTMCISTITLHELMHGAERASRREHQRQLVDDLTAGVEILQFDETAAEHSGQIHATLGKSGQIIGAYDMLIAGHARSRDLTVVTNNLREFRRVEGLRCEDWL
jgi:tRNA(fMet)-specific endonuclease VapC